MTMTLGTSALLDPAPAEGPLAIDSLLYKQLDAGGSDLHISDGQQPWLTVLGQTQRMGGNYQAFDPRTIERVLKPMVPEDEWADFLREKRLDYSYDTQRSSFRAHLGISDGHPYGVFRAIPHTIPGIDDEKVELPDSVRALVDAEHGLHIFSGVTGSGKTTTQAILLQEMNRKHPRKIIMLENPREFRHHSDKSLIIQREIGKRRDVATFAQGIEDAMREAPDVIVIGEMRDPETMAAALRAASSGHLVLATIHAESATDVPTRILDSMPEGRLNDVRSQLSRTLKTVIYQKLIMRKGNKGRALASEVLVTNQIIRNQIRENNLQGISAQMRLNGSGCLTFEDAVAGLINRGIINESDGIKAELEPGTVKSALKRI